jgi:TP901 family phage tail tape measure protein
MANINAQFNYSANFGPVIGQMQKLTAEANILNNTLQNLDKQSVGLKQNIAGAFASDLGKIGGWNAKMVELTDSVDQFGQSLLKQKLTLKQYAQEAIGAFSKSSNAHKLAVREVSREMSQLVNLGKGTDGKQMGMMITPATINLKDFNTQLAVSQKQWSIFNNLVQDGTTHLINFGKNTQWAGRQITVGLTVPLTIYGNTVSKIFREVDAELTRFKKVYGSDLGSTSAEVTERMVNDVRNVAIEFSKSFGIAAKETASLAADLAATGLEGQKLLASLRETTRLAVLGDVSNQDAMKTTLSLQNAFKISTDELASSVNFLNAVENQTSLSLQDLTTAIPKAGPVVKSLGGDVKDLSLLMVALKEGGISAAEGANALKSGMASLINPTKQASITAKQYGIDINGIVQANRGQLMPTIIAFQQQLQLLDEFGKAQVIENVFGKYQFARLSALFDNLNASASQTNAVLGLMGKSNKELAATAYQEMDTLMNSSSKRFQRAIEGIKAQFISIGGSITSAITPILENITGKIQRAIEFFQNLPKPVKSFIKVATGLTAIAGPIIMMVGIFSNFLGYIGKGAMGMVNLGRRMAGIPVQKFEMLTDTQIMAQKATEQLARSFDTERSSVERLNQALGIYRQNLVDAINLNPAFVNRQMASIPGATPTAQLQMGGRMPGYGNNSSAWVPGSGDGDKVPAMLEPGEYVVNKKAAAKYSGTLDQMNFQSAPRFQNGGRIPGYANTSTEFNYDATYPGDGFKLDQSKHLVLANGKVMFKADYDRISSQGGRLPVLMRDDMNPYLNEKYEPSLRYNLGGENPFVGPLPQVSYQAMGRAGVGGSRNVYGYPFKTEQEAGVFSTLNSTTFGANQGGSKTSNIARSINDPQQQAYADWIAGHNTNQFRAGTGVMKRLQMEGHREQMLNSMSPISQSIPLFRGTVLKEKGANEFSGVGARELLMYIKHGMFEKAMGKKIQWSDMQSFSTIPDIANYSKFIESWTNPSNTNSKKAADRQLASMEMLPVIFRLANARGQTGFNISDKAMVQEVMGSPVDEKEWVLNNPSGTISGIRQDMGTKNYIIDLMQKGGRVQSHAEESYREPFQRTDPEYETIFKWIKGELDYFRRRKNVKGRWTDSEKFDAERYKQLLSVMRSVPEGTRMMRGSVLNPGMSGEMSKESQLAMLTAIQTGDYGSLYGMEVSFNDFAAFASDVMGTQYGPRGSYGIDRFSMEASSKLYKGTHSRDTVNGRFFDDIERSRATGKQSKYGSSPVMYEMTAGPNTRGRDITMGKEEEGAPYPNYNPGWVSGVQINEILTHRAKGNITGVSSDIATRQPIIHMQGKQMGGRINGYAAKSGRFGGTVPSGYAFAHIVNPVRSGQGLVTLPFGLSIPTKINSRLAQNKDVDPKQLAEYFRADIAEERMAQVLGIYEEKDPGGLAQNIQSSIANKVGMLKGKIGDQDVYNQAKTIPAINKRFKEYLQSGKLYDARSRISDEGLIRDGWKPLLGKNGEVTGFTKDGKKILKQKRSSYVAYKDPKTKKSLGYSSGTDTINSREPFTKDKMSWLEQSYLGMQSGGRLNGYATETTSWAKKAAAPKAYAGVLQGIPNWATKPNEYQAIVSALQAAGIPESDRLASFYIQDVLAHINPSTTNANGIYEKVWSAANLMKDSQVYNVFLETLRTRKDIGGLLNPSTVSRVAAASGLPMPVVQAELTKIADGVHPNTANGARVMMTLARMFPSRTSPGMPIAVAAGMGARLQGNFYDTLGQRALPSNLPNTTVRAYDPKGTGAPTSTGQGSKVRSTGLIMPSGVIRPSMVMPNIQSIPSAAGGTGTSATVKVDGMGNVLSNGIDDMVAKTVTGQPIAVSSKELLAIGPGGGIAGVTSPGDEARGKIVHPMGTALMRGKNFQQKRLKGFAVTSQDFGVEGGSIGPATREQAAQQAQNTEPVFQGNIAAGRMDKFAASIGFLTSGAYTLQNAFQQFTATAQDGADKFTKLASATTLAITGIQGVSQMLVDNGKIQAMQDKAAMMQGPGKGKMSSGMGKLLGAGSKALGFLGGPVGMIATSVAISTVNKGIAMYQAAVQKAKAAGQAMFKDPIEGAKLLGITLKDTSAIAQTYSKIAEGLGMKGTGKGAYDKTYADVVKKDYGDLIDSLKVVLNQEEKRNKLLLTYINLTQKGFSKEDAKEYVKEIARQSGAMSSFNSINLDNLDTTTEIANQTVASTKALMSSIGTVDKNLIGKYVNKKTGAIYNTKEEADAARQQDSSFFQRNLPTLTTGSTGSIAASIPGGLGAIALGAGTLTSNYQQINEDTGKTLSSGVMGSLSSLGLNEKQIGEAIAGALKTAYSIAATDPAAANQAGAMIIQNIAEGTAVQQEEANKAISEMMKEAGSSNADVGYNFVVGGGLTEMANDVEGKFAGMGPKFSNAILSAIQSGNIDLVNELIAESGGDPSPEAMQVFVNKVARIQALAKIDLEVDIQLEQTKKQLESIKTELGKTFDALIASKQAEIELENKRHDQAMKNLDNEAKRINDKKDILQRNTDYYIQELEREKQAEDYYANQRKTGLSGLKAISGGDVFGFIGAQMDAATSADQFGRDRSMQAIQETAEAGQKKLDEDLRAIDNRREAEAGRHEAELANIEAEIEFLNQKRAVSVGAAEKAISKIEKVVAMSPSDPGYQAAVQEAMSLATTAGMQASQVLQNVDTSSMTKEELANFDKVKEDLGLSLDTFKADTETALDVVGQDVEAITKNIADSLGAAGDILGQVVNDLNQPVKPNSALAVVAKLTGIDVGAAPGAVTGEPGEGNQPTTTPTTATNSSPSGSTAAGILSRISGAFAVGRWLNNQFADGGAISGPGTGTSDSIPIMASNGEYIFKADVVKRIGKTKLDQINNGGAGFAMGGLIGSMPGMSSAPGMANGGFVGSMSSAQSAPGMAAGGFIGGSAPSTPKYNVPSAGGGMSPAPIAQMARGGQVNSNSSSVNSSPVMNFNGAGMDMVMHHVNKAVGGRISSNSRRIG